MLSAAHSPGQEVIRRAGHDGPADKLLLSVIEQRKARGDDCDFKEDLQDMKMTARELKGYRIDGWFPKSIKLLKEWAGQPEEDSEHDSEDDSDY